MVLGLLMFPLGIIHPRASADNWPCWRGPEGNNHASEETHAPIRWDLESGQNIVWKTALPGRGHSSPVVIEDAIFLTTAEHDTDPDLTGTLAVVVGVSDGQRVAVIAKRDGKALRRRHSKVGARQFGALLGPDRP